MKKIIKLTESELVNLVKRVISEEKKMLSESATINGVKVDVSGGGLSTIAKGVANKYLVSVKCGKTAFGVFVPVYTGQISLSSLWDNKGGGIGGKDNTGKVFSIPATKAATLPLVYDLIGVPTGAPKSQALSDCQLPNFRVW